MYTYKRGHGNRSTNLTKSRDIKHNALCTCGSFSVTLRFKYIMTNTDLCRTLMTDIDRSPMLSTRTR